MKEAKLMKNKNRRKNIGSIILVGAVTIAIGAIAVLVAFSGNRYSKPQTSPKSVSVVQQSNVKSNTATKTVENTSNGMTTVKQCTANVTDTGYTSQTRQIKLDLTAPSKTTSFDNEPTKPVDPQIDLHLVSKDGKLDTWTSLNTNGDFYNAQGKRFKSAGDGTYYDVDGVVYVAK